jgi:hydroxyethylthiazole kinase-like uncharacterized protein yjeF
VVDFNQLLLSFFMNNFSEALKRKPDANKGNFGHVLIIGGNFGMGGAVIMAAEASYRAGAGKVTVLTKAENFTALLARLPNAMTITSDFPTEKILENKTVIIIGCGLGKSEWAQELFALAMHSNLPKIIDADALNILSESKKTYDLANSIITPHVGEAARLLEISTDEIQKDREVAIKKLYEKFGATAILKGNGTLIFGGKEIYKCPYGNAGMATAGMGDILSGLIGGLVAQHLENEKAAIFGVNIHALAGDLVATKQGEIGMMPSDLIQYIPQIVNGRIE